ncbi:MAG TPA: TIGR03067 domain-containing protein [Gemmataceae bacterium]|nr:TIGR03067 domain-containing protein [Gemmataceae bacterium]
MSTHRARILTVVVLLAGIATWAGADDGDKKEAVQREMKKFEGTWVMTSGENDGKPVAADVVKKSRLVIQGNRHTVKIGDDTYVGTHVLDPTKSPKTIDVKDTEGPFKGKTLKGIYELTDEAFRICIAPPEKDRPTEFTTKSGTGMLLHEWKKQKE